MFKMGNSRAGSLTATTRREGFRNRSQSRERAPREGKAMQIRIREGSGAKTELSLRASREYGKKRVTCTYYGPDGYYMPARSWVALLDCDDINRQLDHAYDEGHGVTAYYDDGREIPYKAIVI